MDNKPMCHREDTNLNLISCNLNQIKMLTGK